MRKMGLVGAGLLGAALAAALGAAAPAAARPPADRADCVGLLVPAADGGHAVEQRCGAAARRTRAEAVIIVTYFEHINLNQGQPPGADLPVYGGAPCDSAGYTFTPPSWWQSNMSSISVFYGQNCRNFRVRNRAGKTAQWANSVMYMGPDFNDNVNQVKVWA
ncbi:hypothetical protein GCM10010123_05560 [Pilimelia anulata]|uniref:Uncharacterized protein n=1 Tax=Pilimelia anulata TaxID=53371 RepID=A0A8J3B435_9ACTN|nr:hypothetical protein [Pilimelia anulata]GGJ78471.1 hypothetical protein GCM10010123_05560 [Pilimelia anulata]